MLSKLNLLVDFSGLMLKLEGKKSNVRLIKFLSVKFESFLLADEKMFHEVFSKGFLKELASCCNLFILYWHIYGSKSFRESFWK